MKFFENVVQESFSAFPLHPCSHPNYPSKKDKGACNQTPLS